MADCSSEFNFEKEFRKHLKKVHRIKDQETLNEYGERFQLKITSAETDTSASASASASGSERGKALNDQDLITVIIT